MGVTMDLVSKYDPSKAYKGYTFFSPTGSRDVYLVDMEGRFVHYWALPYSLGIYAKFLPNGNLLAGQLLPSGPTYNMPGAGGLMLEFDWDGNEVWRYEDPYINGHDFDRMENGNTLISHWTRVPDDIAAKVKGGVPGTERQGGAILGDCFQEITPDGKVAWQWLAHEHLDFERDILCPLCPRDTLSYANALEALPDGNILTHFRVLNTIAIIDKATGDIIWRWGPGELAHAHNPTLLDNGNILVFDNGLHRSVSSVGFAFSRVLEIDRKSNKIVWEYRDKNPFSFNSSFLSGAQRLPNGNTLICDATRGRIFEVTMEKEIVWEFTNPFCCAYRRRADFGLSNLVFRAYRFGPDYPGLRGKTLDPNAFEWQLHEKGKGRAENIPPEEEEILSRRFAGLGY